MDHPLKAKWKSQFFAEQIGRFVDDPLIFFDLMNITEGGDVAGCKHGPLGIDGKVFNANFPPVTHAIKFIDDDGTKFRGTAIRDPTTNEIKKITGVAKFKISIKLRDEAAADQDEATWVATKQP